MYYKFSLRGAVKFNFIQAKYNIVQLNWNEIMLFYLIKTEVNVMRRSLIE